MAVVNLMTFSNTNAFASCYSKRHDFEVTSLHSATFEVCKL